MEKKDEKTFLSKNRNIVFAMIMVGVLAASASLCLLLRF